MKALLLLSFAMILIGIIRMIKHHSSKPVPEGQSPIDTGTMIICLLIPLVGLIIYGVNSSSNPVKAQGALAAALCSIGISLAFFYISKHLI